MISYRKTLSGLKRILHYPLIFLRRKGLWMSEAYTFVLKETLRLSFTRLRRKALWMSDPYSDHMVLQRRQVLKIRGHAPAGAHVALTFLEHEVETFAGIDGCWCIPLPSLEAGGPYVMTVKSGRHRLVFQDVWVGEVWLISGLSLMEMHLWGGSSYPEEQEWWQEQAAEGHPAFPLRYQIKNMIKGWPDISFPIPLCWWLNRYELGAQPRWTVGNERTIGIIPAYAYYFAKDVSARLQVPVGLICRALSGCPVESFVERSLLMEKMPELLEMETNPFTFDTGFRGRIRRNLKYSLYKRQKYTTDPGFAFESQIRSLDAFPIKGALYGIFSWNPALLPHLPSFFQMLLDSWHQQWKTDFPVYFLQVGRWQQFPKLSVFRDQLRCLTENTPGCEMVVGYDVIRLNEKDPIHPKERREVGKRFARQALYHAYGCQDIVPSGPVYREAVLRENLIYIRFDFAAGLRTSDGQPPREFELAGEDEQFQTVRASIAGEQVILECPDSLLVPRYVRHAWVDLTEANLVNREGLPASTFQDVVKVKR